MKALLLLEENLRSKGEGAFVNSSVSLFYLIRMALEHFGHRNKGPNFQGKRTQNHSLRFGRLWGLQGREPYASNFPYVVLLESTICLVLSLIGPGFNSPSKTM